MFTKSRLRCTIESNRRSGVYFLQRSKKKISNSIQTGSSSLPIEGHDVWNCFIALDDLISNIQHSIATPNFRDFFHSWCTYYSKYLLPLLVLLTSACLVEKNLPFSATYDSLLDYLLEGHFVHSETICFEKPSTLTSCKIQIFFVWFHIINV